MTTGCGSGGRRRSVGPPGSVAGHHLSAPARRPEPQARAAVGRPPPARGSLFYSQIGGAIPCEFCWFQRVLMYPLSILTLLIAARGDNRAARYLLPLPIVGAGTSTYHMLIERGVIVEPKACLLSGGGCSVNWIARDGFGYLTIPTLALTAFLLLIGFLVLASTGESEVPA